MLLDNICIDSWDVSHLLFWAANLMILTNIKVLLS